jgi:MFS family permease
LTRGKNARLFQRDHHLYLTRGFGVFATSQVIGGVAGPLLSGVLLQHMGFNVTFLSFAALALATAVILQLLVLETASRATQPTAQPLPARRSGRLTSCDDT